MKQEEKTFTIQAAANYLGVSCQHFVNLLDNGKIPFDRVGLHRRVNVKDLLNYEQVRDAHRRNSLDSLMQAVEDAGLYDASYTGK